VASALLHWPLAFLTLTGAALAQDSARPAGDADEGQLAFNNACRTCHTIKEGDNRLGPHLHGVVGRKAGSVANYGYSASMAKADVVWDEKTLDRFIENPDAVVPGNNMKPYSGMASASDRAKIVAYLKAGGGR
jgi:cytochrome c